MLMPDCRVDDYYNTDFLDKNDHEFTRGFDWATEAVDNFFDNLDVVDSDRLEVVFDEPVPNSLKVGYTMDFAFQEDKTEERKVETYGDYLRFKILEWLEHSRNDLVVSMIENMQEDVYNAIRNKVLKENAASENPKEYYDSRKFMCSGEKQADGPIDDGTD